MASLGLTLLLTIEPRIKSNIAHSQGEGNTACDIKVIDLIDTMRPFWISDEAYPGDPYNHNLFKQYYSDHHPVEFRMVLSGGDDD